MIDNPSEFFLSLACKHHTLKYVLNCHASSDRSSSTSILKVPRRANGKVVRDSGTPRKVLHCVMLLVNNWFFFVFFFLTFTPSLSLSLSLFLLISLSISLSSLSLSLDQYRYDSEWREETGAYGCNMMQLDGCFSCVFAGVALVTSKVEAKIRAARKLGGAGIAAAGGGSGAEGGVTLITADAEARIREARKQVRQQAKTNPAFSLRARANFL